MQKAAAQAAPGSLLRTVLDRGQLIVGTGSTNAPWHFEDEQGKLTGMDIAMAPDPGQGAVRRRDQGRVRAAGPGGAHPNITTGKVDITIQFMTVSPAAGAAGELLAGPTTSRAWRC